METLEKTVVDKTISQGITFSSMRDERNSYRQPKLDKQQIKKFLKENSPIVAKEIETARTSASRLTIAKNHSVGSSKTRLKKVDSIISSPRYNLERHHNSISSIEHIPSLRILPQLSPRGILFNIEPDEPFLHSLKNSRHKSEVPQIIIPPHHQNDFTGVPLTDPERQSRSLAKALSHTSNKYTDSNGIAVSPAKADSYKYGEMAQEFKDLIAKSNPAYEGTMPRDSPRKKQMIDKINFPSRDVSYLYNSNTSKKMGFKAMLDTLRRDSKDSSFRDYVEQSMIRHSDTETRVHDDLKHLFLNNLNDIVTRRASNFYTQSSASPKHDEIHAALKLNINQTGSNTFRKQHERLFSDSRIGDLISPFTPRNNSIIDIKEQQSSHFQGTDSVLEMSPEAGDFSKNLLESLRSKLPNALKDAPSGRTDVLILSSWLQSNVEQVKKNIKINFTEKLHRTDEIYSLVLNELIRQVSCECLERGELVMKVWKNYIALYNGIALDIKDHFKARNQSREEELLRVQNDLKKQLELKNSENQELVKLNEELEGKYKTIKSEKFRADIKYSNFSEIIVKMKVKMKTAKKQLEIITQEYHDVYYRYHKLRKEKNIEEDEIDFEELLRSKLLAIQAKISIPEINSILLEEDLVENEPKEIEDDQKQSQQKDAAFGAFIGRKIEVADKETEVEKYAFSEGRVEVAVQTELKLVDPQYNELFADMNTIEEFRKEELLRQEIHEENVRNLEEDLQEAMLERGLADKYMKMKKRLQDHVNVSGNNSDVQMDVSMYSNDSRILQFESDHFPRESAERRLSNASQILQQDKSRVDSAENVSLTNVEHEHGQNSPGLTELDPTTFGSIFDHSPSNSTNFRLYFY